MSRFMRIFVLLTGLVLVSFIAGAEDVSDIKISKTIDWDLSSPDATVNVTTYTSPDMTPMAAQVLFIGGLCGAHTLTTNTIERSLSSIAQVADVDYHLYHDTVNPQHPASVFTNLTGRLLRKQHFDDKTVLKSAIQKHLIFPDELYAENHDVLLGFLQAITNRLDSSNNNPHYRKYDYIVLEFDGNRLADKLSLSNIAAVASMKTGPDKYRDEAAVMNYLTKCARLIKPYYDAGKVLWIVDRYEQGYTSYMNTKVPTTDPFEDKYYCPSTYYVIEENTCKYKPSGFIYLSSVLYPQGLTDPASCPYRTNPDEGDLKGYTFGYEEKKILVQGLNGPPFNYGTYYRGAKNAKTVFYDDSDKVVQFLADNIKPAPYNLTIDDTIRLDDELKITGVTAQLIYCDTAAKRKAYDGKTEEEVRNSADWKTVYTWKPGGATTQSVASGLYPAGTSVDAALNKVVVALTNFQYSAWTRVKIAINDDKGLFRTTLNNAQYDEKAKCWRKNPNDGLAHAVLRNTLTGTELKVEAYADVALEDFWHYDVPLVEVIPVPGELTVVGSVWADKTNKVEKTEGRYMVYSNSTVDVIFNVNKKKPGGYFCDFAKGEFTKSQTKTAVADKPVTTIPGDDALLGIQIGENAWAFVQNLFDGLKSGNCWVVGSGSTYAYSERTADRPLFPYWQEIKNVRFREDVTTVGTNFFANMKAIKNVEMNDKVTAVADDAFFKCVSMTNALVGANVTSLGENAFGLCHSMETLRLPNASIAGADDSLQITARITFDGTTPVVDATPKIVIPNCTQTLWGKKELSDKNWDKLTGTVPSDYRFFKVTFE